MRLFHTMSFGLIAAPMLALIAGTGLSANAEARSPNRPSINCHLDFDSPAARAELCTAADGGALVTVTLNNAKKPSEPQVIKALFSADSEKMWQRIWVAEGNGLLEAEPQLKLREQVFKYGPQLLDPRVHAVVDFIANFVPAGTSMGLFDRPFTDQLIDQSNVTSFYSLICQELGKLRKAKFFLGQKEVSLDMIVGDEPTGCAGRCGPGCWQLFQWRKNQYTDECLVHDACVSVTGHWLGECTQAFLTAAVGYLLAPDCNVESQQSPSQQLTNN